MASEQYIEAAKQGLTNIRSYLESPTWRDGAVTVRACISYINASQIMLNENRLEERLWLLNEVLRFAYHDPDAGGITEFSTWCEIEYNRILGTNPSHVTALKGMSRKTRTAVFVPFELTHRVALGKVWLWKSQYWLAKVQNDDRSDDDDNIAERRRYTPNYVEARAALIPAVDFFAEAVDVARRQNRLTGELLALVRDDTLLYSNRNANLGIL